MELLRIVSMLMILTLHYFGNGGVLQTVNQDTISGHAVWLIEAICYVSVNCYMMLTGFYQWKARFRWSKLLSLYAVVIFYSLTIYIVLTAFGFVPFALRRLVYALFPIASRTNWYVTVYFALYLLTPLINYGIRGLDKRSCLSVVIITNILFSVVPTIFFFVDQFNVINGYGVLWFLNVYIAAAYIGKYGVSLKRLSERLIILLGLASILLLPAWKFIAPGILNRIFGSAQYTDTLYRYNSVPVWLASFSLFLLFRRFSITNEKCAASINRIAKTTFGVFYIHTHFMLRDSVWVALGAQEHLYSWLYIPRMALCVTLVFMVCGCIDALRERLFKLLNVQKIVLSAEICLNRVLPIEYGSD